MYDYGFSDSPWKNKREDITTVQIEAGVSNISNHAFSFSKLTSVTISNSVKSIGEAAFWMCTNLSAITIPNSVTNIGNTAFASTKLTTVTIPNSVTNIGYGVFSCCRNLTTIKVSEYNNNYCSENGVLFNKNKTKLIQYPEGRTDETYLIPDSVISIGGTAFSSCKNLASVTIPDGVTSIGDGAFSYCRSLTEVTLPSSVTSIVNDAFHGCENLTSVTILGNVTSISSYAFYDCVSLTSVAILGNVINIDRVAFYDCASLTSVILPISVEEIDKAAFSQCDNLKDVYYSGTREQWNQITIGSDNDDLKNATIHYNYNSTTENSENNKCGDNLTWELDENGSLKISGTGEMYDYDYGNPSPWNHSSVVSVTIEEGVTSIGNYAFGISNGNAGNYKEIFVPKSLKRIGERALCTSYLDGYIDIFYFGSKDEWNSISKPDMDLNGLVWSICHFNYDSLQEKDSEISGTCGAHLSWTLNSSGELTISGTGEMYDFSIDATAPWWKLVLNSVFNKSISIKNVTIENGVSSIGTNAFQSCEDIKSISLPESIVTIKGGAFQGCISLSSILIPKRTTKIHDSSGRSGDIWGTFANCESLTEIKVDDANQYYKSIDGILFSKDGTELLAYPVGKQSEKYSIPGSVITVGNCAFDGCKNLKNVIIPNSVTNIGSGAFQNCTELIEISIPNSITELVYQTFANCTNLEKVYLPNSMTKIGDRDPSFRGCNGLSDVYYFGTEEEWKKITIADEVINNAKIHYNYVPDDILEAETKDSDLRIISFNFGGIPMEIKWGGGLFEHSSSVYDNDLAIAACALSGLAENLESDLPTKDLLSHMGFSDNSMHSDKFNEWNPYNPAYVFANNDIKVNGKTKKLISVTIRGSQTFWGDWVFSDFYDGVFSGFTASTNFIYDELSNYISREGLESLPKEDIIFFIVGHSLGGAVAAKLTTECISRGLALQDNTYTYTIAAPRYSNSTKQNKYSNIFELINIYDKVPNFGFPGNPTGTSHYGIWEEFDANQVTDFYKYWNLWEDGTLEHNEISRNHSTTAYMSYLLTKKFYTNATVKKHNNNSYMISVRCPVDVEIYDIDNNLLGKVIRNEIDESIANEAVSCKIEDDEKYFFVESDKEIYVKFTGTDSGTMEYSIQKLKPVDEVVTTRDFITYEKVELEEGKMLYSEISNKDNIVDSNLYVVDSETGKHVRSVGFDGKETNLAEENHIWIYAVGAVLIVTVTVSVVLIFRKKQ